MNFEGLKNLKESEQKKTYENLLNQLNEFKNKCEIQKMEKFNLEEENKKLFEINVNSIPVERKIEIDEKITNMTEELKKNKIFIDNVHKTLDEKDREKRKIEQQLSEEVSKFFIVFKLFEIFNYINFLKIKKRKSNV